MHRKIVLWSLTCWIVTLVLVYNALAKEVNQPIDSQTKLITSTQTIPNQDLFAHTFFYAVPSSDGSELIVSASNVVKTTEPIILNMDIEGSGGGHRISYAPMTGSGTTLIAKLVGLTPTNNIKGSLNMTTTINDEVARSNNVRFNRAYVPPDQAKTITLVSDDPFALALPNLNTFSNTIYLVLMSTYALPQSLPYGYQVVGQPYNIAASHGLTQSNKFMTTQFKFTTPLPNKADPHTLSIMYWNGDWMDIGGQVLLKDNFSIKENQVNTVTKQLGTYILATTLTWRDSFYDITSSGVSEQVNVELLPGDKFGLKKNALTGTMVSALITPTLHQASWGRLYFNATPTLSPNVTIDVLDSHGQVVLSNATNGQDLSSLPPYPSLKLRAFLTATESITTPYLHDWRVSWQATTHKTYLPFMVK